MKKIFLTIFSILFVFNFLADETVAYANEESAESKEFTMIAPDLDLTIMTEEERAILIDIGWDFTGEVPTLVQTEEDLGFEIADDVAGTVINLGDLFDEMDEPVDNNSHDTSDIGFTLFSLPSLEVGGDGMYRPIFSAPAHGTKVYKTGDLVHCNRFNGPSTDNKHYSKWNAKSYINFAGSDCATGVARGHCTYINDVCNTSNRYHRAWCSWQIGHKLTYHKH